MGMPYRLSRLDIANETYAERLSSFAFGAIECIRVNCDTEAATG